MGEEYRVILCKDFLKIVLPKQNPEPLAEVYCFVSWNNAHQTKNVTQMLIDGINDAEYEDLPKWQVVVLAFLEIQDLFQKYRVDKLMSSIISTAEKFKKYPKFTRCIVELFWDAAESSGVAKSWIVENRVKITWFEQYMITHNLRVPGVNTNSVVSAPTVFGPIAAPSPRPAGPQ